ncbi:MAG TPA: DUF3999 family protein [Thermoguttaceae bacterium]|nr:DUF3999 family protein [Thermoguttaceae bacterium]
MIPMNRGILAAVALFLLAASWSQAADEGLFRFRKDVDRLAGPAAPEDILAATLDGEVYNATGFSDLRVFDAQGKETPFQLQRATEDRAQTVRRTRAAEILELKEKNGNRLELVIDQTKNYDVAGLTFSTPLADYERRVTVYGGDDRTEWKRLVDDALIFDYSRYVDLRNNDVALPKNEYRYFKVVIEEATDATSSPFSEIVRQYRGDEERQRVERTTVRRRPFRIDHLACYYHVEQTRVRQDKTVDHPVQFDPAKDVTQDPEQKRTILEITSRREPLTALKLSTPDVNFSRRVSVLVPVEKGVTTNWVEVGRGTIQMIRFRGFHRRSLVVNFPEQRESHYRIVIENRDDPPLVVTSVSAEGNAYQAVFFAAKDDKYHVCYGAETIAAPDYDLTALGETLAKGYQPIPASLGPQTENPRFAGGSQQPLRALLGSPLLLGGAIGLMVVVLAWILFRAGRRIGNLPEE